RKAFDVFSGLVRQLGPKVGSDNRLREPYFECHCWMVRSYVKLAKGMSSKDRRDKAIRDAAQRVVQLERSWEGFGSDASRKRYEELLSEEPELREQYRLLKKK